MPIDEEPSEKRENILRAALRLFDAYGFHGTSMSAVAESADVGTGTIYRHFDGKEDLVNQLYERAREEAHELILDTGFDETDSVRERLYTAWTALIKNYIDRPRLYRFILKYESSAYYQQSQQSQVDDIEPRFRDIFETGVEEGLFKDLPVKVFLSFGSGVANQLVQEHLNGELDLLDDTRMEQSFEMLWDAYATS